VSDRALQRPPDAQRPGALVTRVWRTQDDIVTDPKQFSFFGDFSGADDALEVRASGGPLSCLVYCHVALAAAVILREPGRLVASILNVSWASASCSLLAFDRAWSRPRQWPTPFGSHLGLAA
jgi:hypothetical protein